MLAAGVTVHDSLPVVSAYGGCKLAGQNTAISFKKYLTARHFGVLAMVSFRRKAKGGNRSRRAKWWVRPADRRSLSVHE